MDIGIRTENNIDGGNIFFDFMDCCGIICLNEEGDKMFEPFCRYDDGDKGFGWRGLRWLLQTIRQRPVDANCR